MSRSTHLIRVANSLGKIKIDSTTADAAVYGPLGLAGSVKHYSSDEAFARTLLPPGFGRMLVMPAARWISTPARQRALTQRSRPIRTMDHGGSTILLALCGAALRAWAILEHLGEGRTEPVLPFEHRVCCDNTSVDVAHTVALRPRRGGVAIILRMNSAPLTLSLPGSVRPTISSTGTDQHGGALLPQCCDGCERLPCRNRGGIWSSQTQIYRSEPSDGASVGMGLPIFIIALADHPLRGPRPSEGHAKPARRRGCRDIFETKLPNE